MQAPHETFVADGGVNGLAGTDECTNPRRGRGLIERRDVAPLERPLEHGLLVRLALEFSEKCLEHLRGCLTKTGAFFSQPASPGLTADRIETFEEVTAPELCCVPQPPVLHRRFEQVHVEPARFRIDQDGF